MENENRVIVVGAGIGGLVLARALGQLGAAVELVEVAETPRAVGAGITLGANAMRILSGLGLGEEVTRRGRSITAGAITDSEGRVLSSASLDEIEARYGRSVAIARPALHEALGAGLFQEDGGLVRTHFGTTLARYEESPEGIEVELQNGTRLRGRALVGADGIHSRVRKLAFGEQAPVYSGYTCWRFSGRIPGGIAEPAEMWGAGQRVGFVPLAGQEEIYAFFVESAPRGTPQIPERRSVGYVRQRFSGFRGEVPRLLAALGDDAAELLHHDIEEIALDAWVRGRVALLGDAAHAMTPNLGQGAAMAIEDALVLARELTAHDSAPAALIAYEARRRARVNDIQARSRNIGRVAQWQSPLAVWARNWLLKSAPAKTTQKTVERVVSYEP